jgi:hypothetical protein
MYSSSPEDMKAVVSYIDQHDMAALDRQAVSRAISRAVTAEASAAQIKAAFQVQLNYPTSRSSFFRVDILFLLTRGTGVRSPRY